MSKEKRPAEMAAPSGTIQIALPDYNTLSGEEQERFLKTMELIGMALQVNGMEIRDKDHTGNLPTIFSYFYGHTGTLDIRFLNNGYHDDYTDDEDVEKTLHTDDREGLYNFSEEYVKIREWLHGILMGMKS